MGRFGLNSPKEKVTETVNMAFKACLTLLVVILALHTSHSMKNCLKTGRTEADRNAAIDRLVETHGKDVNFCNAEYEPLEMGVNFPGGDFGKTSTETVNECACLCQNLCDCKMFHFNTKNKLCWLKHTIMPRSFSGKSNQVSGKMMRR